MLVEGALLATSESFHQYELCSDCGVARAKARSLEVTTVPEPGSILLEQWTVAVTSGAPSSGHMTGLSLLQAVR